MCFEFPILFSTLKEEIYFGVAIQRCWEHKTRNIINDEAVDSKDRIAGGFEEALECTGIQTGKDRFEGIYREMGGQTPESGQTVEKKYR